MKISAIAVLGPACLALAACGGSKEAGARSADESGDGRSTTEQEEALDSLSYRKGASDDFSAPQYMLMQVTLDSLGFSPGVIDGEMGMSTRNALAAFQQANGLDESGEYSAATKRALEGRMLSSATRVVIVPPEWAKMDYGTIPEDAAAKAELDNMGYESLWEKLSERFHTTPEVLYGLNLQLCAKPDRPKDEKPSSAQETGKAERTAIGANGSAAASPSEKSRDAYRELDACEHSGSLAMKRIRVPNISDGKVKPGNITDEGWAETLAALGVADEQPHAARIVVDKSENTLKAYDVSGKLLTAYTVTTGSTHDPLPLGEWKIYGVAKNPPFSYDPSLFWDVPDTAEEQMLPPGPNGPVGVVWIDLSKEHYGIHGTGAPATIGNAQSHGCVRLTNWDAAELAQMVDSSTKVVFQA